MNCVKKLATDNLKGDIIGRLLEHNTANEPFSFQRTIALVAECCSFSGGSFGTHALLEHVLIAMGLLTCVKFSICRRLLEFRG